MIKIHNNTPGREALPQFLQGLTQESLADLSWTDPALGVSNYAWWPEESGDTSIDSTTHKYGVEILTLDTERKVVVVSYEIVALTVEEMTAIQMENALRVAAETTIAIQSMLDAKAKEYEYDSIHTACGWADSFPDASALKAWGAACWLKSKQIRDEVIAGTRSMPSSAADVLVEMPEFAG